jgi:hypothetical protein
LRIPNAQLNWAAKAVKSARLGVKLILKPGSTLVWRTVNPEVIDFVTQKQYIEAMKSAVIPQVRVEPALRNDLEAVLHQGETLSEFVEASVRNAVAFRRVQSQFLERGQAAWEHYQSTGVSKPASEVMDKLQAKLDAKRKQLTP